MLVANAWAACDVGLNAAANSATLFGAVLPALVLATALAGGLAAAAVRRHTTAGRPWQWAALVLATGLVCYGALAAIATPAGYPSPRCEENVPHWWPGWLA